jgi:tRNA threonylcarbamoyl adenosine modification protein YeaZ
MILSIDTSTAKNGIAMYSTGKNKISCQKQWIGQKQAEELLEEIDKLLKAKSYKLKDIEAIGIYRGPGSYTGLRVGMTIANTLGWALNIPVIEIDNFTKKRAGEEKGKNKDKKFAKINFHPAMTPLSIVRQTHKIYQNLTNKKFSKIALPYYPKKF